MIQGIGTGRFFNLLYRRSSQKVLSKAVLAAGALSSSLAAGLWMQDSRPIAVPEPLPRAPAAEPRTAFNPFGAVLVDVRRFMPAALAQSARTGQNFDSAPDAAAAEIAALPRNRRAPIATASAFDQDAPMPPRRPAEFAWSANLQSPARSAAQQDGKSAIAPATSDSRSLFEKVFGAAPASGSRASNTVLAYATPEAGVLDDARRSAPGSPLGHDRWTAVYDISAHTVYLPDGTKLEAHSGLGEKMDDPRFVHVRMRGATPPHVYDLSLRERLFHGVQALRLTPASEGHIFGRTGLLAHTYMLGPRGDSNGCVSFKNYNAFLRAFLNGEVKRLVVVARLG